MIGKKLFLTLAAIFCASAQAYSFDMRDLPIFGALISKIIPKPPRVVRFAHILIPVPIETSAGPTQYIFSISQKPDIDGILFVIDSPGGSGVHADTIADAISRAGQCKPCISFAEFAASAAYLIAASTPYIMASPGAVVGSIGTFWYYERDKDKDVIMLSEEYYKFPRVDAEGKLIPDHEDFYKAHVARGSTWFRAAIARRRPILTPDMLQDMQGKIFGVEDALELKLIDAIGTLKDAVAELYKRAGSPECASVELVHENGEVMARYTPQELVS